MSEHLWRTFRTGWGRRARRDQADHKMLSEEDQESKRSGVCLATPTCSRMNMFSHVDTRGSTMGSRSNEPQVGVAKQTPLRVRAE